MRRLGLNGATKALWRRIVATALPTIVSDLDGASGYSWVNSNPRCLLFGHLPKLGWHGLFVDRGRHEPSVWSIKCMVSCFAYSPAFADFQLQEVFGRKPLLYGCIFIFLLASGLCGGAKNMTWLCICRGVQGE
jgi:MFS family permease